MREVRQVNSRRSCRDALVYIIMKILFRLVIAQERIFYTRTFKSNDRVEILVSSVEMKMTQYDGNLLEKLLGNFGKPVKL